MKDNRHFPAWCSAKHLRKPVSAAAGLETLLRRACGGASDVWRERAQLRQLWKNWDMVMGPDLAALAFPLGHRRQTLLVGGEDNLVLQELSFQTGEILERVNAFMDGPFFVKVELHLALGRPALTDAQEITPSERPRLLPRRPPGLTGHLPGMDLDTPVGRFCAACLRWQGLR